MSTGAARAAVTRIRERWYYRHAGLTLEVNESLPRLSPVASEPPNVGIEFLEPGREAEGDLPWRLVAPAGLWRAQAADGSWLRLRYWYEELWAEFVIDARGERIWISRAPGVLLSELTELLIGPIFSCLCAQRGLTCVHASVVSVDDRVIALVGPSGAGKSTTALALIQAGGTLISDDAAILVDRGELISVAAGTPRIRIRADPARLLIGEYESLEPVWTEARPAEPKRYLQTSPTPVTTDEVVHTLDVIYFLAPWSETLGVPIARPLSPGAALPMLMAQRHFLQAIERSADRRDFALLGRLLRTAPARELLRPVGLETTAQTVTTILTDVTSLN